MKCKEILKLEKFMFPEIALAIWWIAMIAVACFEIYVIYYSIANKDARYFFIDTLLAVLLFVGARIFIEIYLVWFRIYEKLDRKK